jgi:hypothetical protein
VPGTWASHALLKFDVLAISGPHIIPPPLVYSYQNYLIIANVDTDTGASRIYANRGLAFRSPSGYISPLTVFLDIVRKFLATIDVPPPLGTSSHII